MVNRFASAFSDSGARVFFVECDPICVLQACFDVLLVIAIDSVVSEIDIIAPGALGCDQSDIIKLKWIASSSPPITVSVPAAGIQERGLPLAEGAR